MSTFLQSSHVDAGSSVLAVSKMNLCGVVRWLGFNSSTLIQR